MTNSEAKVTPTKPARLAVAEHFKKVKRDNVALLEALKACRQELVNYNCSCKSAIHHIGGMSIHQADVAISNAQ